jgi:hypothetical protein
MGWPKGQARGKKTAPATLAKIGGQSLTYEDSKDSPTKPIPEGSKVDTFEQLKTPPRKKTNNVFMDALGVNLLFTHHTNDDFKYQNMRCMFDVAFPPRKLLIDITSKLTPEHEYKKARAQELGYNYVVIPEGILMTEEVVLNYILNGEARFMGSVVSFLSGGGSWM